jgi:hypothetical protein
MRIPCDMTIPDHNLTEPEKKTNGTPCYYCRGCCRWFDFDDDEVSREEVGDYDYEYKDCPNCQAEAVAEAMGEY